MGFIIYWDAGAGKSAGSVRATGAGCVTYHTTDMGIPVSTVSASSEAFFAPGRTWSIIPVDTMKLIYEIDQILTAARQQMINLTRSVSAAISPQAQACYWFGKIEGFLIRYLSQYFRPQDSIKNNGQLSHGSSVKFIKINQMNGLSYARGSRAYLSQTDNYCLCIQYFVVWFRCYRKKWIFLPANLLGNLRHLLFWLSGVDFSPPGERICG